MLVDLSRLITDRILIYVSLDPPDDANIFTFPSAVNNIIFISPGDIVNCSCFTKPAAMVSWSSVSDVLLTSELHYAVLNSSLIDDTQQTYKCSVASTIDDTTYLAVKIFTVITRSNDTGNTQA